MNAVKCNSLATNSNFVKVIMFRFWLNYFRETLIELGSIIVIIIIILVAAVCGASILYMVLNARLSLVKEYFKTVTSVFFLPLCLGRTKRKYEEMSNYFTQSIFDTNFLNWSSGAVKTLIQGEEGCFFHVIFCIIGLVLLEIFRYYINLREPYSKISGCIALQFLTYHAICSLIMISICFEHTSKEPKICSQARGVITVQSNWQQQS